MDGRVEVETGIEGRGLRDGGREVDLESCIAAGVLGAEVASAGRF